MVEGIFSVDPNRTLSVSLSPYNASFGLSYANSTVKGASLTSVLLTSIVTWFTAVSFVGALFSNVLFLIVYIKHRHLRTPFNSYIFNLCLTDFLLAFIALPGNFITNLYGYWPLGSDLCTLLQYCNTVIGAALRYGHLLISLNRLWAVSYPVFYKNHHNWRLANFIIIAMWIIVHVFEVPVVTIGRMHLQPNDTSRSCILYVDHYRDLALTSQLIGFILPEILVIISGPIIMLKIRHRHFNRIAHLPAFNVQRIMGVNQTTRVNTDECSRGPHRLQLPFGRRNSSSGGQEIAADTPSVLDPEQRKRSSLTRKGSKANSHDRVLAYLIIAVIICWTPNHVYFTLHRINGFWNTMYYAIQYCVFYANSWINPMICYFALPKFRSAINKLFRCRKTKPFTLK